MIKHFLLSATFISIAFISLAQNVVFSEDFDGISGAATGNAQTYPFPAGWLRSNVDNKTLAGNVSYISEAWVRREDFQSNANDSCMFSTSWYSPVGKADDWAWTPPITLTVNNKLSWRARAYDPLFNDGYEVRIMTQSATVAGPSGGAGVMGNQITNSTQLFSIEGENASWTTRTVDLSNYVGETVWIGFRNNSDDKFILVIDDVKVLSYAPEINIQGNSTTIDDGDNTPLTTDHTDFGSAPVASGSVVRTFTIQNTGTGSLSISSVMVSGANAADYSITAQPSTTVAASDSTTFQVTFNPSAGGVRNATVTVNSNDADEGVYAFAITGAGTAPEINVQGNSTTIADGDDTPSTTDHTDFGSAVVASGSIVRTFTIQNTGAESLNISSVMVSGANDADFSVTAQPSTTVAASGFTTFEVTFNPSAVGVHNATVTVNSNDGDEAVYDFAITGTGTAPDINVQGNSTTIADGDDTPSTTDHTDFGSTAVASGSIVRTFTIQNTGTGSLSISSVVISGANAADYSITAQPSTTVAASGFTTFEVTFNPSAVGVRNATVTVNSNDSDEAVYDFAIKGTDTDLIVSTTQSNVRCNGGANGSATISTSGATGTVTYSWRHLVALQQQQATLRQAFIP